ncbi:MULTISPECIES: prophage tail fiber N-terminal domain-containing protein [Escherichia]|uniref:prophage tail fiber N-terminal domain-containing protein n=1 Tax=Escherichia TaxID=561 RepID=UPI0015C9C7EB|nr:MULTISPECIES: prophage tail fiber N-terminal domain-containing protein [Escherichia]EKP2499410.1 prophage tail fiber N-terminal domain-containing protein [Escherichia coli]EKP2838671.1 prophage tail fiber N-terminal domain-containing protein [Escherichia coli]EKP9762819.1 prophage tail fiber N-terminal domain-containing protein [Escherichia coli]ELB9834110.1 prophage tail fiber N-terminal domain-containing protein [Escherichia coli]ELB9879012.1 prophage tail fiber N-terminal domain-containi
MSVVISGALTDGAGIPMSGCHIILKSRVNTSEVVMRTVADVVTGNCGEYCFKAQAGKYCVYLKQDWRDEYYVGDITVYDDSKPGTLNDFLTAPDEGDLKPDVVKRFEEMVAQAQQSAEATTTARDDAERLAGEAENSAQTSGSARDESVDAAERARQHKEAASSAATSAGQSANVALGHENNAAEYARQARISQEASADNAQEAKQYRDEAQQIVDDLNATNASTTEKGLVQLCSDTDNDSEELAATPKAVKTVMEETKTKAPLDSPAFTGTPTTPTPPDDAAGLEAANAAFVRKLLAALVGSSPEVLDTLNELAAALGNDPNFATSMMNALAGKQPLNDVLTAISALTQRADNLLYFNTDGNASLSLLSEKGRALLAHDTAEAMRTELELNAAATMEPQSDIRDRTPGRLALSGMYGFGQALTRAEALAFEGLSDFVEWLKKVTPGRYAVSITDSSQLLTGTTQFNGIIDVMWSPYANSESDTVRKFKTLMCYNQYYQGEHCIHYMQYRYNDSDNSWNMSSRVVVYDGDSLAYLLSRMAGSGSYYKYPAVGVPIMAAYQGESFGADASLGLGDIVPGSRLGPLAMSARVSDTGTYASSPQVVIGGAGEYNFPGRYTALSGTRISHDTTRGYIGLFVRIE